MMHLYYIFYTNKIIATNKANRDFLPLANRCEKKFAI